MAAPDGAKVLISSAASPAVAQLLTHSASEGGESAGAAAVPVQDVVAASPASAALASSVLPLVIAGILSGVAAVTLASGGLARAGLAVAGSLLAGLVATAIVQSWLDVVQGDWVTNAGVLSLTVLAIASVVAGLEALLGKAGLAWPPW